MTIRIAIGSEPMQRVPAQVLKHSIRSRTAEPVEFFESWTPEGGWHPLTEKYERLGGTSFSMWRWVVPELFEYAGRAIYLDSDQVVLADIAELWNALPEGKWIAGVIGAEGHFHGKTPDPTALETSVMVMDCARCDWNLAKLARRVVDGTLLAHVSRTLPTARIAKSDYAALMQGTWIPIELVQSLARGWNHFNVHVPGQTRLLHWSHVRSQPYRCPGHETAPIFERELRAAIRAGAVKQEDVWADAAAGHLDTTWGFVQ